MTTFADLLKELRALSDEQLDTEVKVVANGVTTKGADDLMFWVDGAGNRERFSLRIAKNAVIETFTDEDGFGVMEPGVGADLETITFINSVIDEKTGEIVDEEGNTAYICEGDPYFLLEKVKDEKELEHSPYIAQQKCQIA